MQDECIGGPTGHYWGVELGPRGRRVVVALTATLAVVVAFTGVSTVVRSSSEAVRSSSGSGTRSVSFAQSARGLAAGEATPPLVTASFGLVGVRAAPVSSYCAEAVAAWHVPGGPVVIELPKDSSLRRHPEFRTGATACQLRSRSLIPHNTFVFGSGEQTSHIVSPPTTRRAMWSRWPRPMPVRTTMAMTSR